MGFRNMKMMTILVVSIVYACPSARGALKKMSEILVFVIILQKNSKTGIKSEVRLPCPFACLSSDDHF